MDTKNKKNQGDFFEELGIADLSADKKERLSVMMTEAVLKRILLATLEKLDEKGQEEYEQIIRNGASPEQLEKFLKSKIENYEKLVEDTVLEFKQEIAKK